MQSFASAPTNVCVKRRLHLETPSPYFSQSHSLMCGLLAGTRQWDRPILPACPIINRMQLKNLSHHLRAADTAVFMSCAAYYNPLCNTFHFLSSNCKILYTYSLGSVAAFNTLNDSRLISRCLAENKLIYRCGRGVDYVIRTLPRECRVPIEVVTQAADGNERVTLVLCHELQSGLGIVVCGVGRQHAYISIGCEQSVLVCEVVTSVCMLLHIKCPEIVL